MNVMWVPLLVAQGFSLLGLLLWWPSWSGKSTLWLEGRGWGWRPLIWLFTAIFFQVLALSFLVIPTAQGGPILDAEWLLLVAAALMLIGCPVTFIGAFFWWPRFMLPGWIRERLRAGDPVKTAYPLPEVQHLMTKPQNLPPAYPSSHPGGMSDPGEAGVQGRSLLAQPESSPTPPLPPLPQEFKVGVGRWWFGAVVGALAAVVCTCAVLGVPREMFINQSGMMGVFRVLSVVCAPLGAFSAVYFARAALLPDHVTVAADGVSTRSWRLSFEEMEAVSVTGDPGSHQGQVELLVSDEVFAREGAGNRWFSGRPLGMGGMTGKRPVIRLQPGTKAAPGEIAMLIEHHRRTQRPAAQDLGFATRARSPWQQPSAAPGPEGPSRV